MNSSDVYPGTMTSADGISQPERQDATWEDDSLTPHWVMSQLFRSLLLCSCITLCLIYYLLSCWHRNVRSRLPPGTMGLPIIGETLMFALKGAKFYDSKFKQYGPVFKTHLLGTAVIRVVGAENVKKILQGENDLVTAYWPASVRMLLGEKAVSMCSGEVHKRRRRAIQQAFSYDALSHYTQVMQEIVQSTLRSWCDKGNILGYQECRKMTFDLAAKVLVGFRLRPAESVELVGHYEKFVNNLFSLPFKFPGMGIVKGISARKILLQKIEECLVKKKQFPEESYVVRDVMTQLLAAKGEDALDIEELKELSLELLFAGHSTTASAATSLLIHLHDNRSVIEKILQELDQFGLLDENGNSLSFDVLRKLSYVSDVVKEALRIAPPVGAGFRTVLKSFTLNDYHIPAGWMIAYSIRETQKSSGLFLQSDQFNPDRWQHLKESDTKFHFLPFGGGPRVCAGKEFALTFLRIFVVELVRLCHWEIKGDSRQTVFFPVPHPADNLPSVFTYRQKKIETMDQS
ncbi:hypothetical protein Btru_023916 [Bulinus truncatus]|nr:hypothetical protein Btru_023916 [Bulinus truncatus]